MIIFGTEQTYPGLVDITTIPGHVKKILIYNLYSYYEAGEPLINLVPHPFPQPEIMFSDDQLQLDKMYSDYLMNYNMAFMDLMKIMYPLYENSDILIYILISRDPYRDAITESLIKFIQERYGYISNLINDIYDYNYVVEGSFNYIGIKNIDMDKERYINILYDSGQLELPKED